mgnify:CR=1 FL=1
MEKEIADAEKLERLSTLKSQSWKNGATVSADDWNNGFGDLVESANASQYFNVLNSGMAVFNGSAEDALVLQAKLAETEEERVAILSSLNLSSEEFDAILEDGEVTAEELEAAIRGAAKATKEVTDW